MRTINLFFALIALNAPVASTAPAIPERGEVQEVLVEVAVGSLARRTVVALERDGEVLLPAHEFFALIDMPINVDSLGRLSAVRYPEGIPLFLDPLTLKASVADSSWAISHTQTEWTVGTLFVSTAVLAELLDVRFHVDWSQLRVTVTNPGNLPIARRMARERARRAGAGPFGRVPDRDLTLQRPRWDGAVLDWNVFAPSIGSGLSRAYVRAGVGLNLFGGSAEVVYENYDRPSGPVFASWLGVWPEQEKLRQVGIGDVLGTGPRPARVRGAFITNTPFMRPSFFGSEFLYGTLPPGWEVELYQNGRLIDYAESGAEGRYELMTQLFYGSNPVELRAYGPGGQVQAWERAVPIERERLPEGVFEYGVGGGQCIDRLCDATGNIDVNYGLSKTWTVRGGMEFFHRGDLPSLAQPYASVFGNVASRFVVRAEGLLQGFARASLTYAPSTNLRIGGGGAIFDAGTTAPILTPKDRLREMRAFGFWRPIPTFRTFFFEASALKLDGRLGDLTIARIGGSVQTGVVRWMGGISRESASSIGRATSRNLLDLSTIVNLRRSHIWPLDRLFMRTRVELSSKGVERFDWIASRPIVGETRLDARIGWTRGSDEPYVAFGLTATLPAARTVTQLNRSPGSDVSASAWAEGSVIWNSTARHFDVSPRVSLRRGGLGGTVYLDANANGRFDGQDEPLDSVRLLVGPYIIRTDSRGVYGVWDLTPFVPTEVALDSMSLRNPLWVPAFSLASVVVDPNMVRRLDIPVLPSAEVVGRVVQRTNTGPQPLGGLRLSLVNLETGRRHEAITFHDGEFYVLGLVPGEYEVSIPEWAQEALGVSRSQATSRFKVTIEDGWAVAPFIEIELIPENN